uniref:Uncharacterized protein n=1 Tax=Anopheles braziliensis TaxID=58242 RepID=A0A2M3ZLR6_9DIPT
MCCWLVSVFVALPKGFARVIFLFSVFSSRLSKDRAVEIGRKETTETTFSHVFGRTKQEDLAVMRDEQDKAHPSRGKR